MCGCVCVCVCVRIFVCYLFIRECECWGCDEKPSEGASGNEGGCPHMESLTSAMRRRRRGGEGKGRGGRESGTATIVREDG